MSVSSGGKKLNYHYRIWLSMLLDDGLSIRKIGRKLGIDHSVLSREIKRNSVYIDRKLVYDGKIAQRLNDGRRKKSRKNKIASNRGIYNFVHLMLKQDWSPDAIAGFMNMMKWENTVSHETIYKFIYEHKREWIKYLARGQRKRFRRAGKYKNRRKSNIPGRIPLWKRPYFIDLRNVIGHFEADCMVSRLSKGAILVLLERKTRLVKLVKLPRKTAKNVMNGIVSVLKKYKSIVKSITYDNGTENVLHQVVNEKLNCKSYFCNPYHSWEKGSVENVIGMLRRYIPKGSDLSKYSEKDLRKIEYKLNSRPRKILGYKSSKELFGVEWCNYG